MKKALAAILMLLYLSATSGAMIDMHYCMGQFTGWNLTLGDSSSKCPNCGMHKQSTHGCFQDQVKALQIAKEHKAATPSFQFPQLAAIPVTTARSFLIAIPAS